MNKFENKIALIGMPASQKTSAGKFLAKFLKYEFLDMDKAIEDKHNCTVKDIFLNYGEEYFRDCEYNILLENFKKENIVIATGGGVVLSAKCMDLLNKHTIIWFYTNIDVLYKRLKNDMSRPLLQTTNIQKIQSLFAKRSKLYKMYADIKLNNTKFSQKKTAKNVVKLLSKQKRLK